MYIYKTINRINNLIYVGQSSKDSYASESYLGSGAKLRRAIKKYGKENFTKEILEDNVEPSMLDEREIYWIEFYNSIDSSIGYNLTRGGSYFNLSEVIKIALSTPEQKARIKANNLKLWADQAYRDKVTDSNLKTWNTDEKKQAHSIRMKEAYSNPEAVQKLVEAHKNMAKLECPHCGKICKANLANANHFDNCVHHSDPIKREVAIARRLKINEDTVKIQCPHCKKSGVVGNMNRWHFDKCKDYRDI